MKWQGARQTSCRHCRQDIENFFPYRRGEWRDRGNNAECPDNSGKLHAPYRATPSGLQIARKDAEKN